MAGSTRFIAAPLSEFFGPPAWRYVVHPSFCYWQAERRVFGTIIWGRPNEADVVQMCAAHEVGADRLFRGHTSLVDVRALESVDLLAFKSLLAYVQKRRDAWSPNVARQAVLHGGGFAHATVVGMFQFLRPRHPVFFCDEPNAAYAAVGATDEQGELEALRESLLGVPSIVRRVHAAFDTLPPRAGIDAVAKNMGMSVRSLQRHLAVEGTSLQHERQRHVLRASEQLLEATALDLDSIAAHVGAASATHLIALFRRYHQTTPGEFRDARRQPVAGTPKLAGPPPKPRPRRSL
jgi:AraC-like DNA-binding protein